MDEKNSFSYYWHHIAHNEEIMSRLQNFEVGIMIWAGFSEMGKVKIAILNSNQNFNKYADTLKNCVLPFANASLQTGYIFI